MRDGLHGRSYTNPVYGGYLGDPFVWRHDGVWYAVGSGAPEAKLAVDELRFRAARTGRQTRLFPLLVSEDFVTWRAAGAALVPPDPALGDYFSAPEVAVADGRFYLYYSVGRMNQVHQLRVAVSERPLGPYEDTGKQLIDPFACYFSNDPHPFRDDDGCWYLFYTRDFIDAPSGWRVGGTLVADRLLDMTTLAGQETVVLRPRFDWQRFDADRWRYGLRWDWHLLEGPFVCKHAGRYWCFYSGGDWETERYGVDYAVADAPLGPYDDAGGETGPRVLASTPGQLLGPGHNSVVAGPDGSTQYLVYHAWDPWLRDRHMCLDRLRWTPEGPCCDGPTWTPQTVE